MSQTQLLSPSHLTCPKAPNTVETHHFAPSSGALVCSYCLVTEAQIRKATPLLHKPIVCGCRSCLTTEVKRCALCHLALTVHGRQA